MALQNPAQVYFADAAVDALEPGKTLPSKFKRMLKRLNLPQKVGDKSVAIKIHFGSDIGYTTIHPLFVKLLVDAVKDAGASSVLVTDSRQPADAVIRGYTPEALGCPVVNCFGESGNDYRPEKIGFRDVDEALFAGTILDCDVFIDLSHVKGHGDCGFGGALKNIAMGTVPAKTRGKLHRLEGGLTIDMDKCRYCLKCFENCPNEAIQRDDEKKEISFFFHHCTYCQHCVMVCPEDAITMEDRKFEDFSQGMALVTAAFLKKFKPENMLFINFLMNITPYCDCWGFSSPSLVPDIGIIASEDIAAADTASLDLIKAEDLLPNALPKNRRDIGDTGHLFERIHAKDPYTMLRYLEEYYECTGKYEMTEVR